MVQCAFSDPPNSNTVAESIEPVIGEQLTKDDEENFPTHVPLVPVLAKSSAVDMHVPASSDEKTVVEQTLMNEVEEMDFTQEDVNRSVLYEYNLMYSLHDIHGAALKRLNDLGYKDRELNKQFLVKHNGSMMHVFRDLLAHGIQLSNRDSSLACDVGIELDFLGSSPCMQVNND